LDNDWIDAGNRREAVYNNIGPGSYRFRVKACNNDGIWNEAGATLPIIFLPHFWQTLPFKLAVLAIFGLLLWSWYHLRVSRMRALERLRIDAVTNSDRTSAASTRASIPITPATAEPTDASR